MLNPEELKAISERAEALIRDGNLPDSYSEIYKRDVPALLSMIQEQQALLNEIEDLPMAPSFAMKDGPPKEATEYTKMLIRSVLP